VAVRDCFWPHDVNTILNIKLPARATEDFVAWSGESNGIFSVGSAYRIDMQDSLQQLSSGQSSAEPDGDQKIWQLIWKVTVPQKMRVFAWRAATESLGVLEGLHQRINTINPTCSICGREVEETHHALVRCTLARALRDELRSHWALPPETAFLQAGRDWLFHLLSNLVAEVRARIIFLFWRAWHHRNNVIHGDGKASVTASVQFLVNYQSSFAAVSPGVTIITKEKISQIAFHKKVIYFIIKGSTIVFITSMVALANATTSSLIYMKILILLPLNAFLYSFYFHHISRILNLIQSNFLPICL
jgi:hypothetical protein